MAALSKKLYQKESNDYIVGKRKRVENCPINLLHFPKEETDNYMKQTITDIQVKTRTVRRRNIHSLVLDSFATEASVSHSKYSRKETLQQQQSRRHLFLLKRLGTLWVIYYRSSCSKGAPQALRYGHLFPVPELNPSPVLRDLISSQCRPRPDFLKQLFAVLTRASFFTLSNF